jgi:hypothetical protein
MANIDSNQELDQRGSVFTRENWMIFALGLALIIIGFFLMSGGASDDPNVFDTNEVYSPRRITIAPIVVILGFIVEIYAIFRRPKRS